MCCFYYHCRQFKAAAKSYTPSEAPAACEAALQIAVARVMDEVGKKLQQRMAPGEEERARGVVLAHARALLACPGPGTLALAKLMVVDEAFCEANCDLLFEFLNDK